MNINAKQQTEQFYDEQQSIQFETIEMNYWTVAAKLILRIKFF